MSKGLVTIQGKNGEVFYIEVEESLMAPKTEVSSRFFQSLPISKIERFGELADFVVNRAGEVIEKVKSLPANLHPDKFTVTFAVGLEGKGQVPCLVSAGANANLTVTCEWSKKESSVKP